MSKNHCNVICFVLKLCPIDTMMKKVLFLLLFGATVLLIQNCTSDPAPTPPVNNPPVVEPVNTFKFNGITTYNLKWDSLNMTGYYDKNENKTMILVSGYSSSKYAEFVLTIPGKSVGTFKHSVNPLVNIEVVTGQGVSSKEYAFSTQPNKDMTVTITKMDAVGGKIKGGFAGDLQAAGSLETATISSGAYEVLRGVDQ